MAKYIAYYRVSTRYQNLGLDAQEKMVSDFIAEDDQIIASFTEKETGTNKKSRPELAKAIAMSRKTDSILLIAKLDRLSRNVAFTASLMDSGVQFKAVDMPEADNFTIHIIAAMAQREAESISARTRAALDAIQAKIIANGSYTSKAGNTITKLGGTKTFTDADRAKSTATLKQKAKENDNNKRASAYVCLLQKQGLSLSAMARELNSAGFKTSRGKAFYPMQVKRLLDTVPCE